MVGLVLVCHSAKLAEGVAELAAQMGGEGLRIGAAGGLDQPGDPLGTDAMRVVQAIEGVWSEDGVLVLMDLGSAVLSAEMAVDLLPAERRGRVILTEAPLVEGAVAAAVAAGLGDPLEQVAAEARGALAAKAAHLTAPAPGVARGGEPPRGAEPAAAAQRPALRITVQNRLGLHLRPAAALVRTAAGFAGEVAITNVTAGRGPVSARSLNAVATLGVRHGDQILVRASGPQAEEALSAVRRLADENWGDPRGAGPQGAEGASPGRPRTAAAAATPTAAPGSVLQGLPASPGTAVGRARRLGAVSAEIRESRAQDRGAEQVALERALAATGDDIRRARDSVAARAGGPEAAVFDAHLLFLADEVLLGPTREGIMGEGKSAARAWADAVSAAAAAWEDVDDPYVRARATDLRSVGAQVLRHLIELSAELVPEVTSGKPDAAGLEPRAADIVVASDLTPADAAGLDVARVRGVACAFGAPTSHGAIIARALGIPTVMGAGRALLGVPDGTLLALDGEAGTITVDPPAAAVKAIEERRARRTREETEARSKAGGPAVTRDGTVVRVEANVAGAEDARAAVAAGADGVGLLRTELLFLQAGHLPGEDEQVDAYRAVAEALGGRPLTLRTLDIGADKPLPYLPLEREQNPNLGLRGIRLGLRHREMLLGQLRAALRVAVDHRVRIMFPMVATVDELRRAREVLDEARMSLSAQGAALPERIEVGIMVEVPAAALMIEAFVPHVDFFSIGTNDLAQYVMAAERGNAAVAALADPLQPAVLRLIERTVRAATTARREVAVCGEVAGDPLAIPLLLGLGVTELSMAAVRIPIAKQVVRATDAGAVRHLAGEALGAGSAVAVRRLCGAHKESREGSASLPAPS